MPGSANLINGDCNLTGLNKSCTNSVFVNYMGALTGTASSSDDDEPSSDSGSGSFTGFNFFSFFPLGTTGTTSFFDCRERQAKGMHKKLVNRTPLTTSAIIGGSPLSLTLRYRPAHIRSAYQANGIAFLGTNAGGDSVVTCDPLSHQGLHHSPLRKQTNHHLL